MNSVASWAVFPPNWAGVDTKLRENFRVCGLRLLGLLLVEAAGFWAGFWAV